MRRLRGHITLVQEHRFQLTDDSGGRHLCVLAAGCPVEWNALYALYREGTRVEIGCSSADGVLVETVHHLAAESPADEEPVRRHADANPIPMQQAPTPAPASGAA